MASIFDLIFPRYCLECKKRGKYLCWDCVSKLGSPRKQKGVIITFPYRGIVKKAIWYLKYRYASAISEELADLAAISLKDNYLKFPSRITLIPIPLHPKKERLRGFNQAGEIGKRLAKKLNWDYLPNLLERKIPTQIQANLSREERLLNVKGAFRLNPKYQPLKRNLNLVLFDDVYTTGSTMNEAKKVLSMKGIKIMFCLSVAG